MTSRTSYFLWAAVLLPLSAFSQSSSEESDYYTIETIPIPEGIVLEVGGLAFLPGGSLGVSTRRGEVWIVDNPTMEGGPAHFRRFAHGLHEALGLAYHNGSLYTAQRSELTLLDDSNGDGVADAYSTVFSWPLEGNYHEYSYGPLVRPDGSMFVALNLAWTGFGASLSEWRGWILSLTPEGEMSPFATGMRSPAGMGHTMDGDLFYSENQGDWIASGYITHVEKGDFVGNPAGLRWTSHPDSPLSLKEEDIPDTGVPLFEVAKDIPELKPPAVWIPHAILGISTSDILPDSSGGLFGPFAGQLMVGDQGHSKITRVFLEKVAGVYQGAVFPFLEGFSSGVLRLAWAPDGSLFVGMTSRGWASTGKSPYGLQRVTWTGETPFEIHEVHAMPDGFEFVFTQPIDPGTATLVASINAESFTYRYHSTYGSPPIRQEVHAVNGVKVSPDSTSVRIAIEGLRQGYIYQLQLPGVRNSQGNALLHDVAYYTLNRIPAGESLTNASIPASEASEQASGEIPSGAKHETQLPDSWENNPDVLLTIGTRPNLLFDKEVLQVSAGDRVALTFDNNDDMLHNLVITRPGEADSVALGAMQLGLSGHEMAYVPQSASVLFHTGLLEPGQSETIYFQAPLQPGDYDLVCTFPGHGMTMRGILRVIP